jgi:hypothetical protein
MPDGFSSIADLKVVVDANTDAFRSALSAVDGVVKGLEATTGTSLGGVEAILDKVGGVALGVKGKMLAMAAGLETAVQLYTQLKEQGRGAAEALGVTAEFDQLTASLDDLGMSLDTVVVEGLFALQGATTSTVSELLGLTSATTEAANEQSFFGRILEGVAARLDQVRLGMRIVSDDLNSSRAGIDTTVGLITKEIDTLTAKLADLRAGRGAVGDGSFMGGLLGLDGADKQIEATTARIEELKKSLAFFDVKRTLMPAFDPETEALASKLIGDQAKGLQELNAQYGMTAAAAAEYVAIQRALANATRDDIEVTDALMASIKAQAAEIGRLTQIKVDNAKADQDAQQARARGQALARAEENAFAGAEREIQNLKTRAAALGLNAEAAAELTMRERILQQLRAAGVTIGEEEIAKANALSAVYREQLTALNEQQAAMRQFDEVGSTVANGLTQAFSKFTQTGKFDFKEMISSMLADLARLTFQRSVIDNLFGGGSGGSGGGGSIFSTLLSSVLGGSGGSAPAAPAFGGFRADGGPVEAGKAYVVGERGPELFLPGKSGAISPNEANRNAPAAPITLNIDARGATPDAVQQLRAEIPSMIVQTVRDARSRAQV